ncbi:MAG: HNH endonuclease signature motif containing protein [Chloroflexi bacterium]|nr:HNH endonuclease signature motif containing protein [Chloroflexota bacterium]
MATTRSKPYKRAVPPQIKRRERQTLRANYASWYRQLTNKFGECCANCGVADGLVLDHVLPIAKGGRSQLDNLQLLCATCNRIKGKLVIDCRDFTHSE